MVKNFTLKCSMEERWISAFLSMLEMMQRDGEAGHSQIVGIYADGDGDFRPRFEYEENCKENIECERFYPMPKYFKMAIYDADYSLTKEQWEQDCDEMLKEEKRNEKK